MSRLGEYRDSPVRRAEPPRRQQPMLAHQPRDALPTDGQAAMGDPGPDLPVALPMERSGREDGADSRHDLRVGPMSC